MAQLSINTSAAVAPLQGFPGVSATGTMSEDANFFGALMGGFSLETANASATNAGVSTESVDLQMQATSDTQTMLVGNDLSATEQLPTAAIPVLPTSVEPAVTPADVSAVTSTLAFPVAAIDVTPGVIPMTETLSGSLQSLGPEQNTLPITASADNYKTVVVADALETNQSNHSSILSTSVTNASTSVTNAALQNLPVHIDEGAKSQPHLELAKVVDLLPARGVNPTLAVPVPESVSQSESVLTDTSSLMATSTPDVSKAATPVLTETGSLSVANNKLPTTVAQTMSTSTPAVAVNTTAHESVAMGHVVDKDAVAQQPILGEANATIFSAPQAAAASSIKQHVTTSDAGQNSLMTTTAATVVANLANSMQQGQQNADSSKHGQGEASGSALAAASLTADGVTPGDDVFSTMMNTAAVNTSFSSPLSSQLFAPLSLRQPQWTSDMGQKMQMMVSHKVDEVEVRVDPLDLGPVRIHLKMDETNKAHVTLSAQHGLTREMLENALPRLRDILSQQGIDLGSASVDSHAHQDSNSRSGQENAANTASDLTEEVANPIPETKRWTEIDRLVDQFA